MFANTNGKKRAKTFYNHILELLLYLDLDCGADYWDHWCFVAENSYEHITLEMEVGSRCCENRAESVRKTTLAAVNCIFGTAWESACASRWTHVSKLRCRFIVCALCRRLLPEALKELKTHWGLNDAMIPTLARIVQADALDFSSKSKLKLLRVCEVVCCPSVVVEMCGVHLVERVIDNVLYSIMGHNRKACTVLELCRRNGPISQALDRSRRGPKLYD